MRMPPLSQPFNRAGIDQPVLLRSESWPSTMDTDVQVGLPAERAARIAARYAFVQMKRSFIEAAALVPGSIGELLRGKIRQAHEPLDLWHLREVLLALLPDGDGGTTAHATANAASPPATEEPTLEQRAARCRADVQRQLKSVFADSVTGVPRDF